MPVRIEQDPNVLLRLVLGQSRAQCSLSWPGSRPNGRP
jgi:hypothetical protein